jgi:hypothetical protein
VETYNTNYLKENQGLDRNAIYAEAVLKVEKLNTQAQQRGAIVQGRSLSPYRLRYTSHFQHHLRFWLTTAVKNIDAR